MGVLGCDLIEVTERTSLIVQRRHQSLYGEDANACKGLLIEFALELPSDCLIVSSK